MTEYNLEMRSGFNIHVSILALLGLIGVCLGLMEWTTDTASGGLIAKYAVFRLFWSALAVYAVCSSAVVLLAAGIAILRKRVLSRTAVVFCHAIPVGLVLAVLHFGVHDALQNLWPKPVGLPAKSSHLQPDDQPRRLPVTPRLPAKVPLYREATPGPIIVRDQTPAPDAAVPARKANDTP